MWLWMTLNIGYTCLRLLCSRITDMYYHVFNTMLKLEPWGSMHARQAPLKLNDISKLLCCFLL